MRLGVFPNLTHGPGLVAMATGILEESLAPTRVEIKTFNSGADATTALLSGALDATYIGPVPAASLYAKSGKVAIVSGAAANGASLVVRVGSGVTGAQDLRGKKVAVPSVGNTQDVALRTWLHDRGLRTKDEGGDVAVVPVVNALLPQLFRDGQVAAAWEPEPWVSLLVERGLARVLVDERALWPDGRFLTTSLLVSTIFRDAHPDVVRRLVEANVEAIRFINEEPEVAPTLANDELGRLGGVSVEPEVLDRAWEELEFTWEPLAPSLRTNAERTFDLGYLDRALQDIAEIYRLDDLRAVLENEGLPPLEETV